MKIGKVNNFPWYQELVALAAVVFVAVGGFFTWSHLAEQIPVHFNRRGQADDYASPVVFIGGMVLFMMLFVIIDAAFRYNWLLQERERKRFNWAQLIYNAIAVFLAWCAIRVLLFGAGFIEHFDLAISTGGQVILACLAFLTISEIIRPIAMVDRPAESSAVASPQHGVIGDRAQFYYSQFVNPWWFAAVTLIGGLGALFGAYNLLHRPEMPLQVLGIVLLCLAPLLLLGIGGFRFIATRNGVMVRLGWVGVPMFRLPFAKILNVELVTFSALQDFGGYGVRCGKDNTRAYILNGDSGVKISTEARNYILGCPAPEQFLAVLREAKARAN